MTANQIAFETALNAAASATGCFACVLCYVDVSCLRSVLAISNAVCGNYVCRKLCVATVVVDVSCRPHPADAATRFKRWGQMVVFVNDTAVDVSDV
jgi:hypothetical protein